MNDLIHISILLTTLIFTLTSLEQVCKVAVNYWQHPVPVEGLQSMVRLSGNRCDHFIQPFLLLLITRIRVGLEVVSWVRNIPDTEAFSTEQNGIL